MNQVNQVTSSEGFDQKEDLNLVELLIDGEGNAGFNVAVDVIFHPSAVNPSNRLQLEFKSRVRINNRNPTDLHNIHQA